MIPASWSATLIGSIAAICTTGAFVPQVVRVWRLKAADEISFATFVLFSVGVSVWLVYGLEIDSLPVVVANAVTLVLSLTILSLKVSYDKVSPRSAA
ncbi:MAG TPA: SemiSWEET transporter [Thermoplasmata archaeon]|nr:SemiSWEET transporter [Thermoplasmata archaeon]